MPAQLRRYRNCAVLPLMEKGRSHSTMLWTHFARWTPVPRKPAIVTVGSCASAGFSAAAATRAAIANLSNERGTISRCPMPLIGLERRLHGGCHDELFAVACGLSLLFLFASF